VLGVHGLFILPLGRRLTLSFLTVSLLLLLGVLLDSQRVCWTWLTFTTML